MKTGKLLLIAALSLCAFVAHADDIDDSTLVGNYRTANPLDDGVQRAAAFAADQINQGDLVKIISAQSQVVAGTNYKFKLIISMADGTQHLFTATVFTPLPNTGDSMQLVEYDDQGVYQNTQ